MVSPPILPITLVLKADLAAQQLTVLEGDKVKFVWQISSGRAGYRTSTGTFRPQWTARMWYSRQYEWSPMPHAVFFNRGTAFHATSAVGMLGRPASHGCIRLAPANAAQLYALVHRHGLYQTKIVVHGAPKEPAIAQRKHKRQPEYARGQGYGLSTYPVYAASGAVMRPGSRSVYRANAYGEGWPF
ncbi:MAG: L,D-transpeptidase [Hyphomicrobiaceae bacterium]|nr:MAG: L,D-transpeptidase [Hyphomicrobiaceae bacterium]